MRHTTYRHTSVSPSSLTALHGESLSNPLPSSPSRSHPLKKVWRTRSYPWKTHTNPRKAGTPPAHGSPTPPTRPRRSRPAPRSSPPWTVTPGNPGRSPTSRSGTPRTTITPPGRSWRTSPRSGNPRWTAGRGCATVRSGRRSPRSRRAVTTRRCGRMWAWTTPRHPQLRPCSKRCPSSTGDTTAGGQGVIRRRRSEGVRKRWTDHRYPNQQSITKCRKRD